MSGKFTLTEKSAAQDPFVQFKKWYQEHLISGISTPDAMTLATASLDGKVSARTVLLKDFNETGFVFYTNYKSRKSSQISSNSNAALLFYWTESGRQVRIEGLIEKVTDAESEAYFQIRPRDSQLAAWASEQSSVIPGRRHLDDRYKFYKNKYAGNKVEKPRFWGGFRLIPEWFEFWQDGEFRLHDRLTYTKRDDDWIIERLAP
jgi:pyridoxamine 5'-phosphate oxidase